VVILPTIGIEVPTPPISKCSSSQSYSFPTSIYSTIFSNPPDSAKLDYEGYRKYIEEIVSLEVHRCSVCIPMPKSDTLSSNVRHYSILFSLLKKDLEKEEDPKTIKPSASSPISRQDALLSSPCLT
jgi:hypothetical protein